ncbi:MAG TPA: GntR family transcriptional regulator [Nocardia sp.]|uniref:GntR family transcriptional regulator n=1 Tax=Nocardia TaxID=1817 RepID=UPI002456562D|nr:MULTISPECIES: GntR family transcriptional regulator [Nocardia]HLS78387.1 GntR family transcriptional regulator [Nocardia sp.]
MARRGRVPLGEKVYHQLRHDLASGAVVPTERLSEERLAGAYGVSRTPVREALARLQADGLVERQADGLYPYRPRLEDLDELFELRITLEARGIERVTGKRPVARAPRTHDLDEVRAQLRHWRRLRDDPPAPSVGLLTEDERFHTTLLAAAGNTALAEALRSVHVRLRPVRMLDLPTPERITDMIAEHITIAEHLLAGDPETALAVLVAHIESSRAHVLTRTEHALAMAELGRAVRD